MRQLASKQHFNLTSGSHLFGHTTLESTFVDVSCCFADCLCMLFIQEALLKLKLGSGLEFLAYLFHFQYVYDKGPKILSTVVSFPQ